MTGQPSATVAGIATSAGDSFSGSRYPTLLALERDNVSVGSSCFSCQNKDKWLQCVLPASSVSDEVILLYGSECFGKRLLLVPGAGTG